MAASRQQLTCKTGNFDNFYNLIGFHMSVFSLQNVEGISSYETLASLALHRILT